MTDGTFSYYFISGDNIANQSTSSTRYYTADTTKIGYIDDLVAPAIPDKIKKK